MTLALCALAFVTLNVAFAAGAVFTGGERLVAFNTLFVAACCQGAAFSLGVLP